MALTDPLRAPDPYAALATLPRYTALIWRAYDTSLTRHALRSLERAARARHITLLIAANPADARKLYGYHQHLAEHKLNKTYTDHMRTRPYQIITAAAHSHRAIVAAARAGVDAVLISPVFATKSHQSGKVLGTTRFASLARFARAQGLIVYALGGLTDETKIKRLGDSADGIAGIGLFAQA
ncbi:MAG: thiamine phosphate synthase [Parvibaculaceae bacterium]